MSRQSIPSHLPAPPRNRAKYELLYASNCGIDDHVPGLEEAWREIRIPAGLSAADVYRRLPSAPDLEYGGYVTKTRIRYLACGPTSAETVQSQPCTFHSHPTSHRNADMPSDQDMYSFLKWRHLRMITVGAKWIWVWNKNRLVLGKVRQLLEWESEHLVEEMKRLSNKYPDDFTTRYVRNVIKRLGMRWPRKRPAAPAAWSKLLQEGLGFRTMLIRRDSNRSSR